jgi:hypothetical protein
MLRSLIPFILASLGFVLVALAINMPLFAWQISDIVTDLPPEVHVDPSPWTTKLGESLENNFYIPVYVSVEGTRCRPEPLTAIIQRSRNDETLERLALNIDQKVIPWLSESSKFGVLLFFCGIYIWWFTLSYKRPIAEASIATFISVIVIGILINIWRLFFHKVVNSFGCSGLEGTITLNARLSLIHYETLIIFFAGILLELGALGMILREMIRTVIERKEPSKSAVG